MSQSEPSRRKNRSLHSCPNHSLPAAILLALAIISPTSAIASPQAVAWGCNSDGQLGNATSDDAPSPVKTGLSNVASIVGGSGSGAALETDGSVLTWGDNSYGQLGSGTMNGLSSSPLQVPGLSGVVAISSGSYHVLALKSDGSLRAWGDNYSGQLGNGTTTSSGAPVSVAGLTGVVGIAAGGSTSLAVKSDGTVWSWGGALLGNGSSGSSSTPVQVTGLTNIVAVAAGGIQSMALKSDGTLWAWGYNYNGDLGDGTTTTRTTPVQVTGLSAVSSVVCGASHTIATKTDGTVWTWGSNFYGEAGTGGSYSGSTTPVQVPGLFTAVAIAAGTSHSLAITADGAAWAWGDNSDGQLGDGTDTRRSTPVQVGGLNGIVNLAGGGYYSLAVKSDGTAWSWGLGDRGRLGTGVMYDAGAPVAVAGLSSLVAVSAGSAHTLALRNDGTVWAWGSNSNGQLGDGSLNDSSVPVQVHGLAGVVAIAAGAQHNLAVDNNGTVWAWGSNVVGQLGNGSSTDSEVPVQVQGLTGVIAVAGGSGHSLALKNDGTVWAWGWNYFGQLGTGNGNASSAPVQVNGLTSIVNIAAGEIHSLAVKSDGTAWAWGYDADGEVGNGATVTSVFAFPFGVASPVQVSGLTGVVAVAGGEFHSLALTGDGAVWAWGGNNYGELGVAGYGSDYPVQVTSLSGMVSIAAGGAHSAARRNDGSVFSWGDGTYGELGRGSVPYSSAPNTTPVQVLDLTGAQAIACGQDHDVALYDLAAGPAVASVSLSPSLVLGGMGATGTVTLAAQAAVDTTVNLSTGNSAAQVPGSVTVTAGSSSATFVVTTFLTAATSRGAITAATSADSASANLTVLSASPATISVNPMPVTGGNYATATLTLTDTAPQGGLTVALTTTNSAVQVPASITIQAGQISASFRVFTTPVAARLQAAIVASANGATISAPIVVQPPFMAHVDLYSDTAVVGFDGGSAYLRISGPAPAGGVTVELSSTNSAAQVPASVTVPAGQAVASFDFNTSAVAVPTRATLIATLNATTAKATVIIEPPRPNSVTFSPLSVVGGGSTLGIVNISVPAPAAGLIVNLHSSIPSVAQVPSSITVPAGQSSATFNVTTTSVSSLKAPTISAVTQGPPSEASLLVRSAPAPDAVSPATVDLPPTITEVSSWGTGQVTLTAPAPAGGLVVTLASSSPALKTSATLTFLQGQTLGNFSYTSTRQAARLVVSVSASAGGRQVTTTTIVEPVFITNLYPNFPELVGGASTYLQVVPTIPVPAGGVTVDLRSSIAAAQVPAAVAIAAGQFEEFTTIDTSVVASQAIASITGSLNGSSVTVPLVIDPASVFSITFSPPGLIGGGSATTATVTLTGPAPSTGLVVHLSSDQKSIAPVPTTITVPAGQTTATFPIASTAVTSITTVNITAVGRATARSSLLIFPN